MNVHNKIFQTSFEKVVVIGGGHAGIEAAAASARLGLPTVLVTLRRAGIGQMSCNPAIGGLGKGHLVKEVDALGGLMAQITDRSGIQFRTLNSSKGPAVRASRVQADRELYRLAAQSYLGAIPNLSIIEGEIAALLSTGSKITGVKLADGTLIEAGAVVVTTGTFLQGLMHTGERQTLGGRVGDAPARTLSDSLRELGLPLGRLKTGTPPRIRRDSIDYSKTQEQPGESPPRPLSIMSDTITLPQLSCWITSTNEAVHDIIRSNKERSPMFNGQIRAGGPRYCPSIEDKVFRFSDKNKHTVFLEPEGIESNLVYPNGISTSLPIDVQERFIRLIPGLEQCEIVQPGYAVEYDFVDPISLKPSLETKDIAGLFLAGQINGTSGYEEAAAQGLIAGANAALAIKGEQPLIISRGEGYIGVMIDDLITCGVDEPYRMFTSRAEYRLILREDNAALRLTPRGREFGLVTDSQWERYTKISSKLLTARKWVDTTRINPTTKANDWLATLGSTPLKDSILVSTLVRRPEITLGAILAELDGAPQLSNELLMALETELKFAGYLERQLEDVRKLTQSEQTKIPDHFDYDSIPSLRIEAREKLKRHRPASLGQARRIPGISPATISVLAVFLSRARGQASSTGS